MTFLDTFTSNLIIPPTHTLPPINMPTPTPDFIRTIDSASEDEAGRQPKQQPKAQPKPSTQDRPASKKEQVRRRRDRVLVPQQPIQSLAQAALGSVGSFGKGAKEEEDEAGFDPGFSFGDALGMGTGLGLGDGEAEPAVVLSAVDQILERRWRDKRAGVRQGRRGEIMVDAEEGMSSLVVWVGQLLIGQMTV